jgi:hypothetical protein
MSDTPAHHEQLKLDSVLAAHKRRARLIARLHEQAIAGPINDLSASKCNKAGVTKQARWQKADRLIATAIP